MTVLGSPVCVPASSCDLIAMDPKIPPSISQLFHTNAVPSSMDAQHVLHLLEERKAESSALAKEIEHARARLQRLEQQRDQIESVVHELEALMTPARRMPTDIMAKIFEHYVWDQSTTKADPRTGPLLLAQVCCSWRYLLFSLPCLWSSLQVDLPSVARDWEDLVQFKSLFMHVWFSRSKALPISLFLNHTKASLIPWHALMRLDKEILTLSCRLKELTLHFSPRSLSCLYTFTQSPLPYLERLELQNTNSLPATENPPPIVLHSAPRLKSLTLSWCSLDLRGFQVPWAQLQHLNLEYDASSFWNPVHSDYLETLACCPNLTTLYLGIGAPINDVDPEYIVPVTLHHVHTFKTSIYVQTQYLANFFDALRIPQLRHFDIRNVSLALGSFAGQTECLPLLVRCADTLESLCFSRVDIPDTTMLSCLAQLHHLKMLSFLPGALRLNHGLVTALTQDGGICPALEVLHMRCSPVVPVDDITRLVALRFQTAAKLKQFSLQLATFDYGLDTRDDRIKDIQAQLMEYVEGGLELVLTKSSTSG
ncbi:hypothetical protein EV363DRAFT_1452277 [Boletus edulis]|nr:hypothetical protein EV363DRAFT_1452277 [Boletus edulis]